MTAPLIDFGYLTLVVDMTGAVGTLTIGYRSVNQAKVRDSVTVKLTPNAAASLKSSSLLPPAQAALSGRGGCPRRRCFGFPLWARLSSLGSRTQVPDKVVLNPAPPLHAHETSNTSIANKC